MPILSSSTGVTSANILDASIVDADIATAAGIKGTKLGLKIKSVADYGTVGDGTTDDTVAINAAVADLPTGGILFWPKGTYLFDPATAGSLDPAADQVWIGQGPLWTRIMLKVGSTLPIVNITAIKTWHVEQLGFDTAGSHASAAAIAANFPSPPAALIVSNHNLSHWRNVFVRYSPSVGVQFLGDSNLCYDLHAIHCAGNGAEVSQHTGLFGGDIEYNGGDGIVFQSATAQEVFRGFIVGAHLEGNLGYNIRCLGAKGVRIRDNYSTLAPIGLDEKTTDCTVVDNTLISSPVYDGGYSNITEPNHGSNKLLRLPNTPVERFFPASRMKDPDQSSRGISYWTTTGGAGLNKQEQPDSGALRAVDRSGRLPLSVTGSAGKGVYQIIGVTAGDTYLVDVYWWGAGAGTGQAQLQILDNANLATVLHDSDVLTRPDAPTVSEWGDARYRTVFQVPAGIANIRVQITSPDTATLKIGRVNLISLTGANGGFEGTYASGVAPSWAFASGTGTPTQETSIIHSTLGGSAQRLAVTSGNKYFLSQNPTIDPDRLYMLLGHVYVVSGSPGRALIGWGNDDLVNTARFQWSLAARKTGVWEPLHKIFRPSSLNSLLIGVDGGAQATGNVRGGSSVNSAAQGANLAAQAVDAIFDDLIFMPLHEYPGVHRFRSPEITLSTAGTTYVIPFANSLDMRIRRITVIYTAATDGNTGINISVGTPASTTYYTGNYTTELNQSAGYQVQIAPVHHDIRAGTALIVNVPTGSKTGTGKIVVEVEAETA